MQQIDLLIFDLDGTLVDTRQDLTNSINHARYVFGLEALELKEVMQYVGDGIRNLLDRSLPEKHRPKLDDAISNFRNHYRDHLIDYSKLYPGVTDTLEYFHKKKMAVISNKPEELCRMILLGLGVEHYFDLILGGDSLPEMKPSPEPIFHVLSQLKMNPAKDVMIGDSPSDIKAGHAAGVLTCAVTYGFREEELLQNASPHFCINKIQELKKLFI